MNLIDSMNMYLSRVHAALDVLSVTDSGQLEEKSFNNVAFMLKGMTCEARALLDRWREKNSARRDHTVEVEAIK
jgi:hypothetical protein